MREFTDPDGGRWEAVLGRESWGAFYVLFVPKGSAKAGPGVRRALLEEASQVEASRALMDAADTRLTGLFLASEPEAQ